KFVYNEIKDDKGKLFNNKIRKWLIPTIVSGAVVAGIFSYFFIFDGFRGYFFNILSKLVNVMNPFDNNYSFIAIILDIFLIIFWFYIIRIFNTYRSIETEPIEETLGDKAKIPEANNLNL